MRVQSDTVLLRDVFENFRICLEIYELDPARFLIARRLAWQAALKRTKVIRSFNWYWSYWKYKKVSGEEYVTLFINSSIYKS